jgi:hypothetical protein
VQSFQTQYTRFKTLSNDSDTNNETLGKALLNESEKVILAKNGGKWQFLEVVKTLSTVASHRGYEIPNSIRKLSDVYITVGTTVYMPLPIEDSNRWKQILSANRGTSDATELMYKQAGQVLFDPIPASNSNTISFRGRKKVKDRTADDYTTGTVSISNAGTTVTGSGTAFTSAMVGRWIKFTSGDGLWYEIASFSSTTSIALVKPYEGSTLSGSNYTIGEMGVIPEPFDDLPLWRALAIYWEKENPVLSKRYWLLYDGGYEAGYVKEIGGLLAEMVLEQGEKFEGNHVNSPDSVSIGDPNIPPQDLTGF